MGVPQFAVFPAGNDKHTVVANLLKSRNSICVFLRIHVQKVNGIYQVTISIFTIQNIVK